MNNQYIKKNVIAKKLGELLTGTCQYSPDTLCRDDNKIEPVNMMEFRNILSDLAEIHFQNKLTLSDISEVLNYVYKVRNPLGIVTSRYTYGAWVVRYNELKDIQKILNIPNFDMIKEGMKFTYYNQEYTLKSGYKIDSSFFVVTVQSVEYPESNSFEYCFNYFDIEIFKA